MNKKLFVFVAVLVLVLATLACGSGSVDTSVATSAPVDVATSAPTTNGNISNIRMANNENADNPTNTFAPTDTIYVFFDVSGLDAGAQFEVRWYALNVQGQDANTPFVSTDYTYNNEDTIYAHIESTQGGFPAAQYNVEIYLNGNKVGEQQFEVQ